MNTSIKNWLFATSAYLFTIFAPIAKLMLAIGILVIADFITGVLAAKKRGEPITSKKMRPTIMKGLGYMIAIIVGFVMQHFFIKDFEVAKIVAGLIAFIELKSLDENFKDITGKSLFTQFLKK